MRPSAQLFLLLFTQSSYKHAVALALSEAPSKAPKGKEERKTPLGGTVCSYTASLLGEALGFSRRRRRGAAGVGEARPSPSGGEAGGCS